MPFYEYKCAGCGHELEAMQKFSDAPLRKCPQCGKSRLTKLISAPVFRLKGGGWYETDFKGDKDTKRNIAGDTDKADAAPDKAADTPAVKPAETPAEKSPEGSAEKSAEKSAPKSDDKSASSGSKPGNVTQKAAKRPVRKK